MIGSTEYAERVDGAMAWEAMFGQSMDPTDVSCLDPENRKARLLRFPAPHPQAVPVIGKLAPDPVASLENRIYAELLPALGLRSLPCLGTKPSTMEGHSWLFMEEAKGVPFDPRDPSHTRMVTEAVALLHGEGKGLTTQGWIPRLPPDFYRSLLKDRKADLEAKLLEPVTEEKAAALRNLLGLYDELLDGWSRFSDVLQESEPTLTHGDIAPENLRIIDDAGASGVTFLDWEKAGVGPRAIDLNYLELMAYQGVLGTARPGHSSASLGRQRALGKVLAAATRQLARKSTAKLERYARRMAAYLHHLNP